MTANSGQVSLAQGDKAIVIVGYSQGWQRVMTGIGPAERIVFVEEPEVVRRRQVRQALAELTRPWELIEWEYQRAEAADVFAARFADGAITAVVPGVEYAVPFAARLAERFGLPGAGFGAARILRDKLALRRVADAAGIACPAFREARSAEEVAQFAEQHGYPVVIKPAGRQGSSGVRVLSSAPEVPAGWAAVHEVGEEAMFLSGRPAESTVLVETYVAGTEYSVELLVDAGETIFRNVTAKRLFEGPFPVERGHTVPAELPADATARLVAETERLIRAVGLRSGSVHCEWILDDDQPFLVECAGRLPGDSLVQMVGYAYGVDFPRALLAVLRGEPQPTPLPRQPRAGAVIEFLRAEPGQVSEVTGIDRARAIPGVVEVDLEVEEGATVGELRCSRGRVASVLAAAPTTRHAQAVARAAMARISVVTRPEPGAPPPDGGAGPER